MDTTHHARGDVEDAMRRLLEAVAETQRQNDLARRARALDGLMRPSSAPRRLQGAADAGAKRAHP